MDVNDYRSLSDEQLKTLSVQGDRGAEDALARRYMQLVHICARPFFLAGGDSKDLTQEGLLGLWSAIREYDASLGASFKTYAEVCIHRQILSAIKTASRKKHTPLNEGIPLDDVFSDESPPNGVRAALDLRRITEEQVLARERSDEFFHTFSRCLSSFENKVLRLYLDGLSYRAIAAVCRRDEKAIDNAVQRIRRKLAADPHFGDLSNG